MQQVIIGLDNAEMISQMEALGHSEIDFGIEELENEDSYDDEDEEDADDGEEEDNYEKVGHFSLVLVPLLAQQIVNLYLFICRTGLPFLMRRIRMKNLMEHWETGLNWTPCALLIQCTLPKS